MSLPMLKQKVNINSFQKNCTDLLELVAKGDEIIITDADIPIAKVIPIKKQAIDVNDGFIAMKAFDRQRVRKSEAPENWFG